MNFFTSPAFVIAIIFVVAAIYTIYAGIKGAKEENAPAESSQVAQNTTVPVANDDKGIEIVGADDKTAAVVMALVSHKSGIPLNRLKFKSIRLMEDK